MNRHLNAQLHASSSDDCIDDSDSSVLRRKTRRLRGKRQRSRQLTKKLHKIERISDAESHSDEVIGNESDCSETQLQTAMLGHLQADGAFLSTMSDSHLIDLLSGAENDGSYSSPISNKSDKNMADFEDEDSPLEEELAQLAAASHCLAFAPRARPISINEHFHSTANASSKSSRSSCKVMEEVLKERNRSPYRIAEVCQPGNTLLWDLLMDDKIVSYFHLLCTAKRLMDFSCRDNLVKHLPWKLKKLSAHYCASTPRN